jgi:myo-inositol-1-phosphate synthase
VGNTVKPVETKMQFKTQRKVGKTGVMLIGLGGNNGWYVITRILL